MVQRVQVQALLFYCIKSVVFWLIISNIIIVNCLFKVITVATIISHKEPLCYLIGKYKRKPGRYDLLFVIVQLRCCPPLMVPVAIALESNCVQSHENEGVKPDTGDSITSKLPGLNVKVSVSPPTKLVEPAILTILLNTVIENICGGIIGQSGQTLVTVSVVAGTGIAVFVIVHVFRCSAAMVPVASYEPEEVCMQSPEKDIV
jgi:hypothetical protein